MDENKKVSKDFKEILEVIEAACSEDLFDEEKMVKEREVGARMLFQHIKESISSGSPDGRAYYFGQQLSSQVRQIVCDETNNSDDNLREGVVNIHVVTIPSLDRITVDLAKSVRND
jgi:hypothetical protein